MSTVNTSFFDNSFQAVKDTYYKSGKIKDGTILPQSDTVTNQGYELAIRQQKRMNFHS